MFDYLTVCKQTTDVQLNCLLYTAILELLDFVNFTNHIYLTYMYKPNMALDNIQWMICHEIKQNQAN